LLAFGAADSTVCLRQVLRAYFTVKLDGRRGQLDLTASLLVAALRDCEWPAAASAAQRQLLLLGAREREDIEERSTTTSIVRAPGATCEDHDVQALQC